MRTRAGNSAQRAFEAEDENLPLRAAAALLKTTPNPTDADIEQRITRWAKPPANRSTAAT